MSLIWLDGFQDSSLWGRKYSLNGTPTSQTGRSGSGNCIRTQSNNTFQKFLSSSEEHATIILGAAIKMASVGSSVSIIQFNSDAGATLHTHLETLNPGELRVSRNGTALASTSGLGLVADVWYYIECKFFLHDATGTVEVRVNGVTVINATGLDTKNAGTKAVYDSFVFKGQGSSVNVDFDDLYILNGAGGAYNAFLGDITVETIKPSGNGNASDFLGSDGNSTDNYLLVDDTAYSNTDYVSASVAGNKDKYVFGDLVRTTGSVKGVMSFAVLSKSDSGAKQARLLARTAATDYNGSTETLNTSDIAYKKVWEVNPNTAVDWTIAGVNGAEFGVEVV